MSRDRELRFDVQPSCARVPRRLYHLLPTQPRVHPVRELQQFSKSEVEVDALNDVEEAKGNNGQHGHLVATSLRLIIYL